MNNIEPTAVPEIEAGFVSALLAEDELGAVVRSHIYVESRLNQYLELASPRPEHLEDLNLRYRQKVVLACVLGFDPYFLKPLVALGELRNKFAHKLDTSLTEERASTVCITHFRRLASKRWRPRSQEHVRNFKLRESSSSMSFRHATGSFSSHFHSNAL